MPPSLERLRTVGFHLAGSWALANGVLRFGLDPLARKVNNVLYAFVIDDRAMYIGQTTQGLVKRMQGYRSPGQDMRGGAVTNVRVNRHIMNELDGGHKVDIYWFGGGATYRLACIVVNVAAGLEKALIDELAPPWNTRKAGPVNSAVSRGVGDGSWAPEVQRVQGSSTFAVTVRATQGFSGRFASMLPTMDELISFCRAQEGKTLVTSSYARPFKVSVIDTGLEFIPNSSGEPRREPIGKIRAVLEQFARSGSLISSHYQCTRNFSYVMAPIQAWYSQSERMAGVIDQDASWDCG